MKLSMHWFTSSELTLEEFYPYPSLIVQTIFYVPEEKCQFKNTFDRIKERAIAAGMNWDNKVAVKCKHLNIVSPLYLGWYDGNLVLGFEVFKPDYLKIKNIIE